MALLEFCAGQIDRFDRAAWLRSDADLSRDEKIAAARFMLLKPDTWPGNPVDLRVVAESAGRSETFEEAARRARFDYARFASQFSARLRYARPLA